MADLCEQKTRELQKYLPHLESIIGKIKNNKNDKHTAQLEKFEKLHSLLTSKEKKLKLETLEKCEALLVKLCKNVDKAEKAPPAKTSHTDSPKPVVAPRLPDTAPSVEDLTAPASPSESTAAAKYHNPIVIPIERRETPPPIVNSPRENETLFNRNRSSPSSDNSSHRKTSKERSGSSDLFRRRSPNRDRSAQYDELRKKYEAPLNIPTKPQGASSNFKECATPRSRLTTVQTSYTTSVLKSPPLTMDDLKDLIGDESGPPPLPKGTPPAKPVAPPAKPPLPLPVVPPLPPTVPAPVPPPAASRPIPTIGSGNGNRLDPRMEQQFQQQSQPNPNDWGNRPPRSDPRLNFQQAPRVDPRFGGGRVDPRLNRDMSQSGNSPSQQEQHDQPVRLAYKYNPHPRRESVHVPRPNEFEMNQRGMGGGMMMGRPDDHNRPVVNHLPSVNPSDPRLRNRQFQPDRTNCSPQQMGPGGGGGPMGGSPVGHISSPMSPMANFMDPLRSPTMNEPQHGGGRFSGGQQQPPHQQPFFGNFQQQPNHQMHMPPSNMMPNHNNPFMGSQQHFPQQQIAQPRTYGEYRKFKLNVEKARQHNQPQTNQNQQPAERNSLENHSPLETTVKPMEFSKESNAPSVLDTMYRNTDFSKDAPPPTSTTGGKSFKIPKIRKEPEPAKESNKVEPKSQTTPAAKGAEPKAKDEPKKPSEAQPPVKPPTKKKMVIEDDDEENWDDDIVDTAPTAATESWSDSDKESDEVPIAVVAAKEAKNEKASSFTTTADKDKKKSSSSQSKDVRDQQKADKKTPAKTEPTKKVAGKSTSDKKKPKAVIDYSDLSSDSTSNASSTGKVESAKIESTKPTFEKSAAAIRAPANDFSDLSTDSNASVTKKMDKIKQAVKSTGQNEIADYPKLSSDSKPISRKEKRKIRERRRRLKQKINKLSFKDSGKTTKSKIELAPAKITVNAVDKEESPVVEEKKSESFDSEPKNTLPAESDTLDDKTEIGTKAAGDDSDEELPDTIIDSAISSKNIIEGSRRRTRGSGKFDTSTEATVTPKVATPPKKVPTLKSETKQADDTSAQECSVSSTTTCTPDHEVEQKTAEPQKPPRRKPGPAPGWKKRKQEQEKAMLEAQAKAAQSPSVTPTPSETASTSGGNSQQKDEITKEWLEGFLLNLFNPSLMSTNSVLAMLEKVLDADKFAQVKKILCPAEQPAATPNEEPETTPAAMSSEKSTEAATSDTATTSPATADQSNEAGKHTSTRSSRHRKNELDRLNEDIRDMFICKGVLTASGRRMCSAISEKESTLQMESDEQQPRSVTASPKTKAVTKPIAKTAKATGKRRRGRRPGVFWKGSKKGKGKKKGRQQLEADQDESQDFDLNEDEEDSDDDQPLSLHVKATHKESDGEEELLKIVVGGDATEEPDAKKLTIAKPLVRLKRVEKKQLAKEKKASQNELPKNINADMHPQSENASKCLLCSHSQHFLANHYRRCHPDAEVYTSRLPPANQPAILANESNKAKGFRRKPPNQLLYLFKCPFCNTSNSFTRLGWVDHFATHTGEYRFRCGACSRVMNCPGEMKKHAKVCKKSTVINLRDDLPEGTQIEGHICMLCNYIQMDEKRVRDHMHTQHECFDDEGLVKSVVLLDHSDVAAMSNESAAAADDVTVENRQIVEPPPPKKAKLDGMKSVGAKKKPAETAKAVDGDQNLDIFLTNEQNDVTLDNNIIDFMRDVSFSGDTTPPRVSTLSVADRITERMQIAAASPEKVPPTGAQTIADRLGKKATRMEIDVPAHFNEASYDEEANAVPDEEMPCDEKFNGQTLADKLSKSEGPAKISSALSAVIEKLQCRETFSASPKRVRSDDVIVISDGEENSRAPTEQSAMSDDDDEAEEDDDDDWEDIDGEDSKSSAASDNPLKKNSQIDSTVSRLIASISQQKPKSKRKIKLKSKLKTKLKKTAKPAESTPSSTAADDDNGVVDFEKYNKIPMRRVYHVGFRFNASNHYFCLISGCSFLYSTSPEGLKLHVAEKHADIKWNGFCHACNIHVLNDKNQTLSAEVRHVETVHNNEVTTPVSQTSPTIIRTSASSGVLKIRRLSGDLLSTNGTSQPSAVPLQIANAISLANLNDVPMTISTSPPTSNLQIASAISLNKNSDTWSSASALIQQLNSSHSSPTKFKISNVMSLATTTTTNSTVSAIVSSPTSVSTMPKIVSVMGAAKTTPVPSSLGELSPPVLATTTRFPVKVSIHGNTIVVNKHAASSPPKSEANQDTTQPIVPRIVSVSGMVSKSFKILPSPSKPVIVSSSANLPTFSSSPTLPTWRIISTSSGILPITSPTTTTAQLKTNITPSSSSVNSPLTTPKIVSVMGGVSQPNSGTVTPKLLQVSTLRATTTPTTNSTPTINTPKITAVVGGISAPQPPARSFLKPWLTQTKLTKSPYAAQALLKQQALVKLYKCNGTLCAFSTDAEFAFLGHIHKDLCKIPLPYECWYCELTFSTILTMVNHVKRDHENDIYQCNYCVYRSCERTNVAVHQINYHAGKKECILRCMTNDIRKIVPEPNIKFPEFVKSVQPIACNECPEKFISLTEFTNHVYTHITPPLIRLNCAYCTPEQRLKYRTTVGSAIGHLYVAHRIGYYVCIYCRYQAAKRSEMHLHLANRHPSKFLFCCIRAKHHNVKEEIYATLSNGMTVVKLAELPESRRDTNTESTEASNPTASGSQTDNDNLAGRKIFLEPRTTSTTPQAEATAHEQQQQQPSKPSSETETSPSTFADCDTVEDRVTKLLNAADDVVRQTGLHQDKLFKCGTAGCGVQCDLKNFRIHLHDYHPKMQQKCAHCNANFFNTADLIQHYYTHERHRYFCFMCFHTDRSAAALAKHFGEKHAMKNKFTVMTYALIKGRVDAKRDFFFVCPNSVRPTDVCRFGDRLLKLWERNQWSEMKKSFDVDEIDKLPRQAIFLEELHCAVCQYKTKVRTNLYRHLLFHKQEVKVASIDPVNPVPCLNAAEKHFDKMTNLACSSHSNKPATDGEKSQSTVEPKSTTTTTPNEASYANVPKYLPVQMRFNCGIADCPYIGVSEDALKKHLNVIHANEKAYDCAHCKVSVCTLRLNADRVMHHLKFHGPNMYQCDNCVYFHFQKATMERHVRDIHRGVVWSYTIHDRAVDSKKKVVPHRSATSEGTTAQTTATNEAIASSAAASSDPDYWQCMLCKRKHATELLVQSHMSFTHSIEHRYQCSKCKFGCNKWNDITEHARKRHVNVMAEVICYYTKLTPEELDKEASTDTTPLWSRDPNKVKNIRGILVEQEPIDTLDAVAEEMVQAVDKPIVATAARRSRALTVSERSEKPALKTASAKETPQVSKRPVAQVAPLPAVVATQGSIVPKKKAPKVEYFCQICYVFSASSILELRAHMKEAHADDKQWMSYLNKIFKFVCFHCSQPFARFTEYQSHWESVHKTVPARLDPTDDCHREGRAPWFTVWRNFQCSRCPVFNNYRELAIHHFLEHSQAHFATRDIDGAGKCGHCEYIYGTNVEDLVEHYKTEHLPASQDKSQTPVPSPPLISVHEAYWQDLTNLATPLQFFKCNICHTVLNDMEACKVHCASLHNITKTHPCTVMQGTLYKCPMCQFCSADEDMVLNHIFNKVKSGRFSKHESLTRPASIPPHIWPYTTMEVVFPNGFIVEKYRLEGIHPYGDLDKIDQFLAKKTNSVQPTMLRTKSVAVRRKSMYVPEPAEADNDEQEESNKPKRRMVRRASTYVASIDCFGSDDEYVPSAPKKKKPTSSKPTTQNKGPTARKTPTPPNSEFSYYGRQPDELDLSNIKANVSVDGINIKIAASDFSKFFKKELALKLQKIDEVAGPSLLAAESLSSTSTSTCDERLPPATRDET